MHEIKSTLSHFHFHFLGTRVFVARVARQTKTREYKDLDARFTANLGYSHHQKSVVLDAPSSKESSGGDVDTRRIVAYVGGVDLTGSTLTLESDLAGSISSEWDFFKWALLKQEPMKGE